MIFINIPIKKTNLIYVKINNQNSRPINIESVTSIHKIIQNKNIIISSKFSISLIPKSIILFSIIHIILVRFIKVFQ